MVKYTTPVLSAAFLASAEAADAWDSAAAVDGTFNSELEQKSHSDDSFDRCDCKILIFNLNFCFQFLVIKLSAKF